MLKRCWVVAAAVLLLPTISQAQSVALDNLSEASFEDVVKELSTNFMHTSVSGAGTLGDIFGFEVGLIGGVTKTPNLNSLVQAVDSSAKVDQVPHAQLLGVLTVPLAITIEAGLVPKIGSDDFKFNSFSLAGKWTPTELLWEWPLNVAVKGSLTKAHVEFATSSGGGETSYEYDNTIMAVSLLASKSFVVVEPYVGVGYVKSTGDLGATGTYSSTLFTFTDATSASEDVSGTMFQVGAEFKLIVVKLGLEWTKLYDADRYSGKLSFYF